MLVEMLHLGQANFVVRITRRTGDKDGIVVKLWLVILVRHVLNAREDDEGRDILAAGRYSFNRGSRLSVFGDTKVVSPLPLSNDQLVLSNANSKPSLVYIPD